MHGRSPAATTVSAASIKQSSNQSNNPSIGHSHHFENFIAMAEPTQLSALEEEKKRVLLIIAKLITDLEDVKKLVMTTLQTCQKLRNEYLDEMFPDTQFNTGSPPWDGEEGGESEECEEDDPDDDGDGDENNGNSKGHKRKQEQAPEESEAKHQKSK